MRRATCVLALVALVALAGCGGDGGAGDGAALDASTDATDVTDVTATAGVTGTPTATPIAPGGHPVVTDGTVNVTTLVRGHLATLRRADSFTVTNNGTNRYAGNGSVASRLVSVREFDLADERWYVSQHAVSPDGTVTGGSERFVNGSRTCLRVDGGVQCQEGRASRRQAVGLSVEATALETVAGPAFAPAGTVRQNGSQFYRYTADELRADVPEGAARELGENATLRSATLLVTPGGRIAEYRLTYERDAGPVRGVIERVYRTSAVGATNPRRPGWVPDE